MNNIYSDIIKGNLEHHNMKLKDLAILTGKTEKYLSEIINDKKIPSMELTLLIEKAFGIPENTIFRAAKKQNELIEIEKDEKINNIYLNIKELENNKLLDKITIKLDISSLFKGSFLKFKKYLTANSTDYFKYKDEPMAYYWIAKMDRKFGNLKSSGKFQKSMGDTIIKKTLDILYGNNSIKTRVDELIEYLDEKGIILRNSGFISNSNINGCVIKKDKQYFIFMNDKQKREYQYIFALLHELLHIFRNKKDEGNEDVVNIIKTYEKKYNKTHKELGLAMDIFEMKSKDSKKWNKLRTSTKKKILFESI